MRSRTRTRKSMSTRPLPNWPRRGSCCVTRRPVSWTFRLSPTRASSICCAGNGTRTTSVGGILPRRASPVVGASRSPGISDAGVEWQVGSVGRRIGRFRLLGRRTPRVGPLVWSRSAETTEVVPTAPEAIGQQTASGESGSATGKGPGASFDVVVIGGGPGGYAAALYGALADLSVAVIEFDKVGGTCLHRGCIPAKQFLETASVFRTVAGSAEFGVNSGTGSDSSPVVDFAVSQGRKQKVVNQLFKGLSGLMKGRGITVFAGTGTLLADHRVRIDGNDGSTTEIHGTDVILAAGSVPRTIPRFEVDGTLVMTSDEVLDLKELPGSVAVIGGGAIGCEFASMLSDLGSEVTVLEALPAILNGCDEDVAAVVSRSFRKRGIQVKVGVQIHGHTPNETGGGTGVSYGGGESLPVDAVVISGGRRPRTEGPPAEGSAVVLEARG